MAEGLVRQFVGLARTARRTTLLGPLLDAWHVRAVLRAIDDDPRDARVLGPEELAPYLRRLTPLGSISDDFAGLPFDWVIVPHGAVAGLPAALVRGLRNGYQRVLENRRYLLLRSRLPGSGVAIDPELHARLDALLPLSNQGAEPRALTASAWHDRAILVTTFERATALERSLPQLCGLGAPVLVMDDGSREAMAERNRAVARGCGAEYLRLPRNRGISAALTVGLEYLLADARLQWISCVQDDVDVRPDTLSVLQAVEDAAVRPVLTGYDAALHAALEETAVGGVRVRLKRETSGVHLHAHRDYWRAVLPIPTEYLGAPKRRWEASLEDSWITVGAPNAAARRGIPVVCVPGLVRSFLWHAGDSTWGNPNSPEPLLAPDNAAP